MGAPETVGQESWRGTPVPGPSRSGALPRPGDGPRVVRDSRARWATAVRHLVLLEVALASVLVGFAFFPWALVVTAPVAAGCILFALGYWGDRWLHQRVGTLVGFRRRQAQPVHYRGDEPRLVPLRELQPGIEVHPVPRHGGPPGAVVSSDGRFSAVLSLDVGRDELLHVGARARLDVTPVASALAGGDLRPARLRFVSAATPAPASRLPPEALAARSYLSLPGGPVPAQRWSWLGVEFDALDATDQVAARGGGSVGGQRCAMALVDRARVALMGAGIASHVLDQEEVAVGLSLLCGVDPTVGERAPADRRTVEHWAWWRCDQSWHATFEVTGWPGITNDAAFPTWLERLELAPASLSVLTVDLAARPAGGLTFGVKVRLVAEDRARLQAAETDLVARAGEVRVRLRRLDGDQGPGLLATLPVGAGRR